MASLSSINRPLNRALVTVESAKYSFQQRDELESDGAIMEDLVRGFHREYAALLEVLTGEKAGDAEACQEFLIEATRASFAAAIDKRDDRNSPESIAAAKADAEREMA